MPGPSEARSSRTPDSDELILRDLLAIDRTILANERTVLSYLRTMLALVAAGGSLMHFVDAWWSFPTGLGLIAAGLVLLGIGFWRFRRVSRHLQQVRR